MISLYINYFHIILTFLLLHSRKSSTVASWSEIIQSITQTNDATSNDGSHDSNINKVKEQLNNALGAKRSHEQGNLLPQVRTSFFFLSCILFGFNSELVDECYANTENISLKCTAYCLLDNWDSVERNGPNRMLTLDLWLCLSEL